MMERLINAASRQRWPVVVLAFVVLLIPLMIAGPESGGSPATTAVIVLGAACVLFLLFLLALNLSGRDPGAEARALDLAPDPVSAALFVRWMRRSKHFRFVGGLAGGILGLSFAASSLGSVLVGAFAGIAVGGAAAELHSFGRRRTSPRSADIAARRLVDYVTPTDTMALFVIAVVAVGMIAAGVADSSDGRVRLWTAVAALAAVVASVAMQWAVVVRTRPALSDDLRRADDLMRRLAATQGFTRPAIAFALLMVSHGLTTFGNSTVVTIAVIVIWALAIAWYVASRQSQANMRALVRS